MELLADKLCVRSPCHSDILENRRLRRETRHFVGGLERRVEDQWRYEDIGSMENVLEVVWHHGCRRSQRLSGQENGLRRELSRHPQVSKLLPYAHDS